MAAGGCASHFFVFLCFLMHFQQQFFCFLALFCIKIFRIFDHFCNSFCISFAISIFFETDIFLIIACNSYKLWCHFCHFFGSIVAFFFAPFLSDFEHFCAFFPKIVLFLRMSLRSFAHVFQSRASASPPPAYGLHQKFRPPKDRNTQGRLAEKRGTDRCGRPSSITERDCSFDLLDD